MEHRCTHCDQPILWQPASKRWRHTPDGVRFGPTRCRHDHDDCRDCTPTAAWPAPAPTPNDPRPAQARRLKAAAELTKIAARRDRDDLEQPDPGPRLEQLPLF